MGLYQLRDRRYKKEGISIAEQLQQIHNAMLYKMEHETLKNNAKTLQDILFAIKTTARELQEEPPNAVKAAFKALIEETYSIMSSTRDGQSKKQLMPQALFHRKHGIKTIKEADDIFEEELAALLAAAEHLGGNNEVETQDFLSGTLSGQTKAMSNIPKEAMESLLLKLAQAYQKDISVKFAKASGKIDVHGLNVTLEYSYTPHGDGYEQIGKLMELMQDATFSVKNYIANPNKNFSDISLSLGNTNLYKAITGALSEVLPDTWQQRRIFIIGVHVLLRKDEILQSGDKKKIDRYNCVQQHFAHLRFIYELRGSGLMQNNSSTYVKYIIYNDPASDAIFVRDTASIIIDALKGNRSSLFGDVSISASKIQSV